MSILDILEHAFVNFFEEEAGASISAEGLRVYVGGLLTDLDQAGYQIVPKDGNAAKDQAEDRANRIITMIDGKLSGILLIEAERVSRAIQTNTDTPVAEHDAWRRQMAVEMYMMLNRAGAFAPGTDSVCCCAVHTEGMPDITECPSCPVHHPEAPGHDPYPHPVPGDVWRTAVTEARAEREEALDALADEIGHSTALTYGRAPGVVNLERVLTAALADHLVRHGVERDFADWVMGLTDQRPGEKS